MFRTILKVIYIGLSMFIGMIMYMGTYQSNGFQAILDRAEGYIESGDYDELARMLGGLVNKDEVITIDPATKENQILLYEGTTLTNYNTFKETDKKEEYETIEHIKFNDAYFLLILNPTFDTKNVSGDKVTNKSSVVFTTADPEKSFEYKLIQNESVNKDFYSEFPKTDEEAILSGTRDMIALENAYGFFSLIFDQSFIDIINAKLGTPVTGFYLQNNVGEKVENTDKAYDFSFDGEFFDVVEPLKTQYDIYINGYLDNKNGKLGKDEFKKIDDSFRAFTEGFDKTFAEHTNYAKGFEQKELITSAVTWKTIGELTVYALIVIILYFLLFKFHQVAAICNMLYCKITGKKDKHDYSNKKKPRSKSTGNTNMTAKNVEREAIVKKVDDAKLEANKEAMEAERVAAEEAVAEEPVAEEAVTEEAVAEEPVAEEIAPEEVVTEEVVDAEVVKEEPLSEVVADAPLEDAEVVEAKEPKETK